MNPTIEAIILLFLGTATLAVTHLFNELQEKQRK